MMYKLEYKGNLPIETAYEPTKHPKLNRNVPYLVRGRRIAAISDEIRQQRKEEACRANKLGKATNIQKAMIKPAIFGIRSKIHYQKIIKSDIAITKILSKIIK